MREPDIDEVTRRLEAVVGRERRKAMEVTLLTALCTPAFVVVGAVFVGCVAAYVFYESPRLSRLTLIRMQDRHLHLTPEGLDFLHAAADESGRSWHASDP